MKISGNTILITGGGSGIGRALAHRFNDLGNIVIVTGRRMGPLTETIGKRKHMTACLLDVADPAAIKSFADSILANHPELNILINNAGVMRYEDMTSARDLGDAEAMVTTNLLGPIRMIDAFVAHLAAQPDSAIVTISSGLAFVPMVAAPTYSATKAAIHSYSLSLREQLRGKTEVIEIIPPAVQTDLTPGQATRDGYLPLETFVDQVMTEFRQRPTPEEIVVERARILRNAEQDQRFPAMMRALNPR
ncbi:SDR family oxidoreductase [Sphingorhabdus sp. M41]|uniref:SDR family oxidoreductase n=1 Tax=Sphingorhabdus sp. M41 TaxID=1806885 RepID=UPI00078BA42E|nr:SDR family oxidoreductase [Sphingorhabdus sp. M41]AMO71092.1 oxidoreductase [Sphingorhabdus sp. M41]